MQKKKGISLIVLVITIIVMLILAGAIILTLNNSGIIDEASNAVDATNEAQIKQIVQLGWAEAYANGARTKEDLKAGVEAIIARNKIDVSEYGILVTTNGVKVVKGWIQDGLTVLKGNFAAEEKRQKADIGDTIAYVATGTDYNDGWKVLGASEDGELLIMSAKDITTWYSADSTALIEYTKGKKATGARSISGDDVNKITGYDPKTAGFGKDKIHEYGNKVTIDNNGNYTSTNGCSGSLVLLGSDNDDLEFEVYGKTLEMGVYSYSVDMENLDDIHKKAYKMLFENADYFLSGIYYAIFYDVLWECDTYVYNNEVSYVYRVSADGLLGYNHENIRARGIRAVVSLASDISLNGNSDDGWTY